MQSIESVIEDVSRQMKDAHGTPDSILVSKATSERLLEFQEAMDRFDRIYSPDGLRQLFPSLYSS